MDTKRSSEKLLLEVEVCHATADLILAQHVADGVCGDGRKVDVRLALNGSLFVIVSREGAPDVEVRLGVKALVTAALDVEERLNGPVAKEGA